MEKEKKRNGLTNAGTCTSVVWEHRGADRKALPPKNIIIKLCSHSVMTSHVNNGSAATLRLF